MKICFHGGSSGTIMSFPFGVGNWKSGEEKEIDNEIGKKLTDAFSLLKEVGLCKKEADEKVVEDIIDIEGVSNNNNSIIKKYRTMSRDELVTECINRGINPPDNANKSKIRKLLYQSDEKNN